MEDLNFVIQSKNQIKSLQSENETLKNNLVEANREIDRLKRESKQEISRLNDKISFLMNKDNEFALRTSEEARIFRLLQQLRDIVYEEKYDEWVNSPWRLMERTDFEDFLRKLRTVLDEV